MKDYFSSNYESARQKFRELCLEKQIEIHTLDLGHRSPEGNSLTIDIAWLGAKQPKRILLHSSGLHGIEGFAGSAIQQRFLSEEVNLPKHTAVILAHILNPYGMAWLRRANEENVDLNRNFIEDSCFTGCTEVYKKLDELLNPTFIKGKDDFKFYTQAAERVLIHGFDNLKETIAVGQYEYPKGLFYGGNTLQKSALLYRDWVGKSLKSRSLRYLMSLDVHTGLGHSGQQSLFVEPKTVPKLRRDRLSVFFGQEVIYHSQSGSVAYPINGGLCTALPHWLPGTQVDFVTEEFGTLHVFKVLQALRQENYWHHYGNKNELEHVSKQRIKNAFCPSSEEWKEKILDHGFEAMNKGIECLQAS